MLLRHMCLRTGVDLGHFFLPLSFVLIWGWGVPGSEKLVVRVVQLLLILCYIPPKQKAWRWRYFGMPFTKRSLIQVFPLSIYLFFSRCSSFSIVLSIMPIKLRGDFVQERAPVPNRVLEVFFYTREEPCCRVGLKALGYRCGPAICRSIISRCDVLSGVGLPLVLLLFLSSSFARLLLPVQRNFLSELGPCHALSPQF